MQVLLGIEDQGNWKIVNEKTLCISEYSYKILEALQVSTQAHG